ncbi:P-loop containing nucleoside triphosphate hydrolase protein [Dioszegia hungarica]|uniref:P-loop containing nucleoside triphosphate hydrolase protein n=1 Tax=Dioszegia hungarica TaxID=4972 RepID=A0AA38LUV7_9TREE|nr:P-loop containing nucleoside triphosphate hydrolase protein [Dioszegia hungarica]KAI9636300.1 P-loop containing nucleoside triphosphate hydrolase protein [Dioszegia hungarica]
MLFKITVLGDGGVGKTALTVQFTMSSFVEAYDPTIEDCYRKQWVVDDQPCLLEVLDTAGQEEYTALRDQWIRDGEGFLIVYSITNRRTFERLDRILERVHRVKDLDPPPSPFPHSPSGPGGFVLPSPTSPSSSTSYRPHPSTPRIPMTIVGNKRDMVGHREVSTEEGRGLAQYYGAEFFECSAKTNVNVEACFKSLVRQIKAQRRGGDGGGGGGSGGAGGAGGGGYHGGGGGGYERRKKKKCVIL